MTKKIIEVVARDDVKYALKGTLDETLKEVKQLIKEYGKDARLDIDAECESYSYTDTRYAYARIFVKREETDEEYSKRMAQEAQYAEMRAELDKAEYARLKKQFGEK